MLRQLGRLRAVLNRLGDPPLAYAGDVFDVWNPPLELVNFALKHLPSGYAIPGNHDLPQHSYDQIRRCGYWTLAQAGLLTDLKPGEPVGTGWVILHGFPYGTPLTPLTAPHGLSLDIAIVHAYVWKRGAGYPGAPESTLVGARRDSLQGYHAAFFGDNHVRFMREGSPHVVNCGGFMVRRTDEKDHEPCVSVLYTDGGVEQIPLGKEGDAFRETTDYLEAGKDSPALRELARGFASLKDAPADFREEVSRELERRRSTAAVRVITLRALEGG